MLEDLISVPHKLEGQVLQVGNPALQVQTELTARSHFYFTSVSIQQVTKNYFSELLTLKKMSAFKQASWERIVYFFVYSNAVH